MSSETLTLKMIDDFIWCKEMALGIADNRTLSFQKDAAKKALDFNVLVVHPFPVRGRQFLIVLTGPSSNKKGCHHHGWGKVFHHILSKLYLRSIHQVRDVQPEVDGMGAGDRGGMAALNRTPLCCPTLLITTTSFPHRLAGWSRRLEIPLSAFAMILTVQRLCPQRLCRVLRRFQFLIDSVCSCLELCWRQSLMLLYLVLRRCDL